MSETLPPRVVGAIMTKPIEPDVREGLRRLCDVGKMIRRSDGSYGTTAKKLITNAVATRLKARDLAVSGFSKELVPTNKGIQANGEGNDAAP